MHIGLIGGIGPAATEFYYRHLVQAHALNNQKMDLTIVHAQTSDLIENVTNNEQDQQAQIFLHLVKRLQAAGAEAVAVTSMAGHFCIEALEAISPLPVINAIPLLEAELIRRKITRVGLLGTRVVMNSSLYGGISAIETVLPQGNNLDVVHSEYIAMATAGQVTDQQRALFFSIGRDLCEKQGAEAVVLAGTDLFLAFDGQAPGFPVIDSALVHIDALHRISIEGL